MRHKIIYIVCLVFATIGISSCGTFSYTDGVHYSYGHSTVDRCIVPRPLHPIPPRIPNRPPIRDFRPTQMPHKAPPHNRGNCFGGRR